MSVFCVRIWLSKYFMSIITFVVLFWSFICARMCKCGDGAYACVVAMTTSSALFIGHSISVAALRDRADI